MQLSGLYLQFSRAHMEEIRIWTMSGGLKIGTLSGWLSQGGQYAVTAWKAKRWRIARDRVLMAANAKPVELNLSPRGLHCTTS
jgi:hypothetical protein